jgi:hypothetical protein
MRLLLPGLHLGKESRYPQTVVLEKPASQDTTARQTGEGNAATKEAKRRTSDGGPGHHLRDDTTAKAKEQGRQEEEEDHETQPHYWMDSRMADAAYYTTRERLSKIV